MKKGHLWHFMSSLVFILLVGVFSVYVYYNQININLSVFSFLILGLAIFRLTWLFVYDLVMDFVRDYFRGAEIGTAKRTVAELLHCPWCVGVWMSLVVVLLYVIHPITWLFIVIIALAGLGTAIDVLIRFVWRKIP